MGFNWTGRDSGGPKRIDDSMIREMRSYWDALRDGDMLPRRDQVDPRGISNALEHSFLIERIAPGIARFRIAGMVYNDLMGMDICGLPMSCMFMGDTRDALQDDLEKVFRAPAILTMDLMAERSLGRPNLRGRMLILPMLDQRAYSDLAIGCLQLDGDVGRAPRRFSVTATELEMILPNPKPQPFSAVAPVADPERPPRAVPGVPHLRLVKG